MSTAAARIYNWVTDKNAGTPITASRMDAEFDAVITKLNQKVIIATSAPSGPIAGMLWLDSTNKLLKQYRNSEWVVMGCVHVGTAAPTTCQEGDLWYDSTNNKLFFYTTTTVKELVLTGNSFGTLGQMLYLSGGVATAPISLAMGTISQVLTSNGIGSAPSWTDKVALGAWVSSYGIGTAYQATTDGFVVAYTQNAAEDAQQGAEIKGYTDSNANPTTLRLRSFTVQSSSVLAAAITMPVRKDDYWKTTTSNTTGTATVYWIPLS